MLQNYATFVYQIAKGTINLSVCLQIRHKTTCYDSKDLVALDNIV